MQPLIYLTGILKHLADSEHYLFSVNDLRSALPHLSVNAFKTLLARAAKKGLLLRVCRGIYLYPEADYSKGFVLFHTAAKLRVGQLNYISLETALSDAGVISQIPLNWITLMSSGRTYTVNCGRFGHIEFIHTKKSITTVTPMLDYDEKCRLWRANIHLALQDMVDTKRNMDLVDWEAAREFV